MHPSIPSKVNPMTETTLQANILRYCEDEFTDHLVYHRLAEREKDQAKKNILEQLSKQEEDHYRFWNSLIQSHSPKIKHGFIGFVIVLRYVFGLTFVIKFLERHEEHVIDEYKSVLSEFKGKDQEYLEKMIGEEEKHEKYFISQINEGVVKYLGFIVLGLADAIIEISGVHAGFLGITSSTTMAGVAGLVVGFAAAISMGAAAYLQAKQDPTRNPVTSAIITGISYILAVTLLALPYFLTGYMVFAFTISLLAALLLTAYFTFYSAILFDRSFSREFLESAGLTLATAAATFFFGELIGRLFGIHPYAS